MRRQRRKLMGGCNTERVAQLLWCHPTSRIPRRRRKLIAPLPSGRRTLITSSEASSSEEPARQRKKEMRGQHGMCKSNKKGRHTSTNSSDASSSDAFPVRTKMGVQHGTCNSKKKGQRALTTSSEDSSSGEPLHIPPLFMPTTLDAPTTIVTLPHPDLLHRRSACPRKVRQTTRKKPAVV